MKPRLQTSLGQHLVLTPQLRQALHLLQLPALELEAEIAAAVESNPLLDWAEEAPVTLSHDDGAPSAGSGDTASDAGERNRDDSEAWDPPDDGWSDTAGFEYAASGGRGGDDDSDPASRMVQTETLQDHLTWQGAGRGQRRRDLARDVPGLAHPGAGHAPAAGENRPAGRAECAVDARRHGFHPVALDREHATPAGGEIEAVRIGGQGWGHAGFR